MVVFFVDDLYLVHELFQLFGSIHRSFVSVREPSSPVALPISFNAFPICKGRIAMLLNAAMLISLAASCIVQKISLHQLFNCDVFALTRLSIAVISFMPHPNDS